MGLLAFAGIVAALLGCTVGFFCTTLPVGDVCCTSPVLTSLPCVPVPTTVVWPLLASTSGFAFTNRPI